MVHKSSFCHFSAAKLRSGGLCSRKMYSQILFASSVCGDGLLPPSRGLTRTQIAAFPAPTLCSHNKQFDGAQAQSIPFWVYPSVSKLLHSAGSCRTNECTESTQQWKELDTLDTLSTKLCIRTQDFEYFCTWAWQWLCMHVVIQLLVL